MNINTGLAQRNDVPKNRTTNTNTGQAQGNAIAKEDPITMLKVQGDKGAATLMSGAKVNFQITDKGCIILNQLPLTYIPNNFVVEGKRLYVTAINNMAFYHSKICRVPLPDTLVEIGKSAFAGTLIDSIEFPYSLRIIEQDAFKDCQRLNSIRLNEGLKMIGEFAFLGTAVKRVDIPASVTEIGSASFPNGTTIRFHGEPPKVVGEMYYLNQYTVYIPKTLKEKYLSDNYWQFVRLNEYEP